jgi:putative protease
MKKINNNTLELLAPVGSLESFFAAVENGADAVFCGLKTFSARAKAKNFTLEELELLKGYAEARGVKIYVALNTLIKECELRAIIELLAELDSLSVDGLIIQDLGLYRIAHQHFPEIPLHASTQMLTHNLAGVLMLQHLGFRRAVLARELTLQEITAISRHSSLELEHFVHGALCYSMSGHCLFSSYIDGRSGNRGRCIQPCRRRYHMGSESGFYFSTSDFSAIELIPDLVKAGVSSFKIEGRMKSAEYVATVVSSYRMVIDAAAGEEKKTIQAAQENLSNAMGRSSSHGFLKGTDNKDLVLSKQKGGIGKIIGRVQGVQSKSVSFKTVDAIHVGDRLRIQPGNDRAGQGFIIRTLKIQNRTVKRAGGGSFVSIPLPFQAKFRNGDLVFKLSTGKAFTMSEEACSRRLSSAALRSHPVHIVIHCTPDVLAVFATVAGLEVEKKYSVQSVVAENSPLSEETLSKVFSSTGNAVLSLASLQADNLPSIVIKPSRLKEIRREFYGDLVSALQTKLQQKKNIKLQEIESTLEPGVDESIVQEESTLFVVSDDIQDMDVVSENPDIQFIFPLTESFYKRVFQTKEHVQGIKEQIIWDLPSVVFDGKWAELEKMVASLKDFGFDTFRLNNHGHCMIFSKYSAVKLIAGPWLYSMNSQAMKVTSELGIHKWTLSLEDDHFNIGELLAGKEGRNILVIVYSPVDLFTSRINPSVSEENFILESGTGELLNLTRKHGLTLTQAEKPYSIIGNLDKLQKMNCSNFVLDLRGNGLLSTKGRDILQAYYEDRYLPGVTPFNFERGLA